MIYAEKKLATAQFNPTVSSFCSLAFVMSNQKGSGGKSSVVQASPQPDSLCPGCGEPALDDNVGGIQ